MWLSNEGRASLDDGLVDSHTTNPQPAGDALITFGGCLEVKARVVFVHPMQNFSILQYDAQELAAVNGGDGEEGLVAVAEAEFVEEGAGEIKVGDSLVFHGLNPPAIHITQRLTVTKKETLKLGDGRPPMFVGACRARSGCVCARASVDPSGLERLTTACASLPHTQQVATPRPSTSTTPRAPTASSRPPTGRWRRSASATCSSTTVRDRPHNSGAGGPESPGYRLTRDPTTQQKQHTQTGEAKQVYRSVPAEIVVDTLSALKASGGKVPEAIPVLPLKFTQVSLSKAKSGMGLSPGQFKRLVRAIHETQHEASLLMVRRVAAGSPLATALKVSTNVRVRGVRSKTPTAQPKPHPLPQTVPHTHTRPATSSCR